MLVLNDMSPQSSHHESKMISISTPNMYTQRQGLPWNGSLVDSTIRSPITPVLTINQILIARALENRERPGFKGLQPSLQ